LVIISSQLGKLLVDSCLSNLSGLK